MFTARDCNCMNLVVFITQILYNLVSSKSQDRVPVTSACVRQVILGGWCHSCGHPHTESSFISKWSQRLVMGYALEFSRQGSVEMASVLHDMHHLWQGDVRLKHCIYLFTVRKFLLIIFVNAIKIFLHHHLLLWNPSSAPKHIYTSESTELATLQYLNHSRRLFRKSHLEWLFKYKIGLNIEETSKYRMLSLFYQACSAE